MNRYTNTSNQYVKLYIPGVGVIEEHRYIMEQHIGRNLEYNEVVHHINGDKQDNRIENLEIISRSSHAKEHNKIRSEKAAIHLKCSFCGKDIVKLQSDVKYLNKSRGQTKFYCNKECSGKAGKGRTFHKNAS